MITIGTDCSGIEAPIEALKQLGISFQHKWSCEIDKFARKSILANYHPETLYEDITKRDHSQLPDVDIYVCGFPCQSFSLIGKKLGTNDPRGNIMLHCIQVIKAKQPPIFILENVKNFKFIQKGKPFKYLINELRSIIDEQGDQIYNVYPDIYNTKDYGIPQNRERIYIIGIKCDIQIEGFVKPQLLPMRPLDDFIIDKNVYNIQLMPYTFDKINQFYKNKINILKKSNYVISRTKYVTIMNNISPTIITNPTHYLAKYKRYMTPTECLLLQGFTNTFKQVVTNTQIIKQTGNTMSVNVLKTILQRIFTSTIFQNILT
jgi:DNA (cytosine-5)-methyltransferase 1